MYNLTGRVVDAGTMAALDTVVLSLDGLPIQVDMYGAFASSVVNGTYTLTASAPGYANASFTLTIAGADAEQDVHLNPVTRGSTGGKPWPGIPGFGLATAIAGLLIIALYRYGRA
jgi:hypothetical protein